MKLLGPCVCLMMWAAIAHAEPTTLDVSQADLNGLASLPPQLEEPVGLRVTHDLPRLGLRAGDLVWAIDGESAVHPQLGPDEHGAIVYLEVRRGAQRLELRLVVAPEPRTTRTDVRLLRDIIHASPMFVPFEQVTRNGKPSGVLAAEMFPVDGIRSGDLIRSIDGRPTRTPDDATAAMSAALSHDHMVVDLERLGGAETVTIQIHDPDKVPAKVAELLRLIRRTDASHYVIPRKVIDALLFDPSMFMRSGRVVPSMHNGVPDGFKLYGIRPGSLFAALGLQNGDTVERVNGNDLTSADKALDAYVKLRDAKAIELTLRRRGGQTVQLTYKIP